MYALIGAGPMGLAMARNLSKAGVPFIGFEIHSDVGGLWDIDSPTSTMYHSAHLISSRSKTEFAEFPMAAGTALYPSHRAMRDYFRDYAREFDLYRHYEFSTEVLLVVEDGADYLVTTQHQDEAPQTRRFRGVLIANGTLHCPNRITLPAPFDGELLHSADYKHPDIFRDKRVLVIGCGNSGADIAVEAVHHAASVDILVRRGYYFLPKFLFGRPIDTLGGALPLPRRWKQTLDSWLIRAAVGKPSDYGLPDPDYRLYESHPVINSLLLHHLGHGDVRVRPALTAVDGRTLTFANGERADYDLILTATGYRLDYPFLTPGLLDWDGHGAPQLFLNVFPAQRDNLLVLGMVEAAGLGWEGRNQQAQLVARYLVHQQRNSAAYQAFNRTKSARAGRRLDGGYDYLPLERMAYYVSKQAYLSALAHHSRQLAL